MLTVNKQAIARAFGRAAQLLQSTCGLQRLCGEALLALPPDRAGKKCWMRAAVRAGSASTGVTAGNHVTALDLLRRCWFRRRRYTQRTAISRAISKRCRSVMRLIWCWSNLAVQWCSDSLALTVTG